MGGGLPLLALILLGWWARCFLGAFEFSVAKLITKEGTFKEAAAPKGFTSFGM